MLSFQEIEIGGAEQKMEARVTGVEHAREGGRQRIDERHPGAGDCYGPAR
jgi:hypothetical protein